MTLCRARTVSGSKRDAVPCENGASGQVPRTQRGYVTLSLGVVSSPTRLLEDHYPGGGDGCVSRRLLRGFPAAV